MQEGSLQIVRTIWNDLQARITFLIATRDTCIADGHHRSWPFRIRSKPDQPSGQLETGLQLTVQSERSLLQHDHLLGSYVGISNRLASCARKAYDSHARSSVAFRGGKHGLWRIHYYQDLLSVLVKAQDSHPGTDTGSGFADQEQLRSGEPIKVVHRAEISIDVEFSSDRTAHSSPSTCHRTFEGNPFEIMCRQARVDEPVSRNLHTSSVYISCNT